MIYLSLDIDLRLQYLQGCISICRSDM